MSTVKESAGRILWWGSTLACPRCGSRHIFRRYLFLLDDCPGCGLHFEREAGYFTGALAINIIGSGGLMTLVLVTAIILTVPDIPVALIMGLLFPIGLFGPVVFYPFSKTIWMAVDHALLQRMSVGNADD